MPRERIQADADPIRRAAGQGLWCPTCKFSSAIEIFDQAHCNLDKGFWLKNPVECKSTSSPLPVEVNQVSPGVELQWGPYPGGDSDALVAIGSGCFTDGEPDVSDDGQGAINTPYFVWLTRREINSLIRSLRRARKMSYGEDE